MNSRPLVVDLDGTLMHSDLLLESGLSFLKTKPLSFLLPIKWLLSGKAVLKERIAKNATIDIKNLPYNKQVLEFLEKEKRAGREIILATASHSIYANQVASHLKLFDRVFATEGNNNLSATRKRDKLVDEYGEQGFDYMGNSHDDLHVWKSANRAYIVNPDSGVVSKAKAAGNVDEIMVSDENMLKVWSKQLRIHQWVKNLLLFVPLLASHQIDDVSFLINALLAFLFFGMCASSVYLLNDLLDLDDDRHHSKKRTRPLASGALSIKHGVLAIPFFLFASFVGAYLLLPWKFVAALGVYYVLTLAYSIYLKRKMMVDVITLALLYTLRIIAGAFAFGLSLTYWMLAFSMFMFLSLAFVKRYAELKDVKNVGKIEKARGRDYYPSDLEMISSLGAASGYLSVLVLALYIQDNATVAMYSRPEIIWLACPLLLFWISRVWLLTHRGQMHEDPIVFAIKDKVSLAVGILFGYIFWLAV